MAYPLDPAAQNACLDALFARDVSGIPTSFEVALFNAHPLLGGTELTSDGGYVRGSVNVNSTDFPAAASGAITSAVVVLPTSTDAWSDTAPYAVLIDAADSTTQWWAVLLDTEVNVTGAGETPSVVLTNYWNIGSL